MRQITDEGLALIKRFEGCKLEPYECSANVPTVGYGATYAMDGQRVTLCDAPITQEQANELFERDIKHFSQRVDGMIGVPVSPSQFSALVSLAYNIGCGDLKTSTLLRKLNLLDYQGAADEFPKWRRAGGEIIQGLVNRRAKERDLFLS
jgi:lysozyme